MTSKIKFSAACVAFLLGACGGGGSGTPGAATQGEAVAVAPRIARFAGHWVGCWATSANTTEKDDVLIEPIDDQRLKITRVYTQFDGSSDCTGNRPWLLAQEQSEATLVGETLTLGGVELEKFTRTGQFIEHVQTSATDTVPVPRAASPTAAMGLGTGQEPHLFVGDDHVLDANGFPRALNPFVYSKLPS